MRKYKKQKSVHENWVMYQKDPTKVKPQNNTAAKWLGRKAKKLGERGPRRIYAPGLQGV